MPTHILVFGTGAVGCIYATILEKGGAKVTTVCRGNYDAVKLNGILIRSAKWGHIRSNPTVVRTVEEAAKISTYDYLLVTSKAFPQTAEIIKTAVTPGHTTIVLAQNGIALEDDYAKLYPDNTMISGVVYLPTTQVSPGIVEHGTPLQRLEIGTFPSNAGSQAQVRLQEFSDLFTAGDADAPIHEDIQKKRWEKLSVNASFNPITALTLCDDANYLRSSHYAPDMARDVMREVGKIATAAGYPEAVTEASIQHHMERHLGRLETGGKEPSMLVDILHARPIEVEAILGNAIRKAEELKIQVPYLKMLYVLAKARDFSTRKTDGWKPIATVA